MVARAFLVDLPREKGGVIVAEKSRRPSSTFSTGSGRADLGIDDPLLKCRSSLSSATVAGLFLFPAAFLAWAFLVARTTKSFF